MQHKSHDWSPTGFCSGCRIYMWAMDAIYECSPSSAEPETQEPPPVERGPVTAGVTKE
jgi:hypothetical protein